jgi:CRISPR system Cascade subunit CasA
MYDLLVDELIGVRTVKGVRRMTLPQLLAGLSAGEVEGYTGLRAHQADPWHVFLVQLAASVQARHPTDDLPTDPAYWREGLLELAEGKQSAWHLIWEDVTQPAFMQHPWKSWEAEAKEYGVDIKRGQVSYDPKASSPDEIDVLVTAKNHDVKLARIGSEAVEAWLFALVLLQTTSGYQGAGNYGIVRMNSGTGSRAIVSWTSSLHPAHRFREELTVVKSLRSEVVKDYGYANRGIVLTWLGHWNRQGHQHLLSELEPWFIEAARPIRLMATKEGVIRALGATSKARQIGPKTLESGDVGDPWTSLNVQDKKKGRSALTLSAEGFTPQLLTNLLFAQGFELTPLQQPREGEGEGHAWFVASCLVRGQGRTEGFHQALVPVPPKARLMLFNKQTRDTLGHLAQELIADAENVRKALDTALVLLTEGGPDKPDFDRVKQWLEGCRADYARYWETGFFPTLWRAAEESRQTVRQDWQQYQVDGAQRLLDEAIERLPLPANRTWRAITKARNAFYAILHKNKLPRPQRRPMESDLLEEATS